MSLMKRISLIFSQGEQGAGPRRGPARDPGLQLREAARAAAEGTPRRGRRRDQPQARRAPDRPSCSSSRTSSTEQAPEGARRWAARTSPARRSPASPALTSQVARPAGPARPAAGRGGEAHARLPAAAGQGRVLPHQEGDHQGHVHRGRGADPDQRGVLRHLRGDGRRRHGDPARRGQDRADAGPRRRHRRADRLRRARRRHARSTKATTSPASWRRWPRSPTSRPSSRRSSAEIGAARPRRRRSRPPAQRTDEPSSSRRRGGRHDRAHPGRGAVRSVAEDSLDDDQRARRGGRGRRGGRRRDRVRRPPRRAAGRVRELGSHCPRTSSWTRT